MHRHLVLKGDGMWSWKTSKQPEPLFSYLNNDLLKVKTINVFFSNSQSLTVGLSPVHVSSREHWLVWRWG